MTIEELKSIQADNGLTDRHMVWVGPSYFTIAHTDAERASPVPLEECRLHQWMLGRGGPPLAQGIYTAIERIHDPVSQSFRSDDPGYDFEPFKI